MARSIFWPNFVKKLIDKNIYQSIFYLIWNIQILFEIKLKSFINYQIKVKAL